MRTALTIGLLRLAFATSLKNAWCTARSPGRLPALSMTVSEDDVFSIGRLRRRASEIEGARTGFHQTAQYFQTDTQLGFLNVHKAPDDPHRLDNVVGRLPHGRVVLALDEYDGLFCSWVRHDHGGWSVREYADHIWLKRVQPEEFDGNSAPEDRMRSAD